VYVEVLKQNQWKFWC